LSRLPFLPRAVTLAALLLLAISSLAGAQSTPLLYEVKSASTTVYLFGTIHVGARKLYPLSPQSEEAFAHSAVLALEADPTDQGALMAAMSSGLYRPPDNLRAHLSPALFQRLEGVLPRVGLPIEYAQGMKPYLLAMTLAMIEVQRQGYDAQMGLDVHFAKQAKADDKRIVELESMAEQIELFAGLPMPVQEAMLQLALDGVEDGTMAQELEALVGAWAAGDAEAIHASTKRELDGLPQPVAAMLYERVYDGRNRRMAEKIEGFLAGGQVHFVAVGAGHLTGESGLPVLLREKGFSVRRL
jgi:uncharacterized protein YbaP (TraB family)